jgi:hypothetical protein
MVDLAADGNGNRVIDAGDYEVLRSEFSAIARAGRSSQIAFRSDVSLPEPASRLLLLIALAGLVGQIGRHRALRS